MLMGFLGGTDGKASTCQYKCICYVYVYMFFNSDERMELMPGVSADGISMMNESNSCRQ